MPVITFALPNFLNTLLTASLLKKLLMVGIPLFLAILQILGAGSIPTILNLFFLNPLRSTPVLLPISTARSLCFKLYSLTTEAANSNQCFFPALVMEDSYG